MIRFIRLPLLATCASVSLFAAPSGATDALEEVVVTSSRVPTPLRQIGTSVSIITAQDLQVRGFNGLAEALRYEPSVALSNTGGSGQPTAIRIRGEEGFRTLVRIDGIEISDPSGVQVIPNVEHLLSAGINRVEILRGPQGLLYGADAGGVINIMTPRPETGLTGEVSAEGGRYGSRQLAGNVGGGNNRVNYFLSAVDYETDGFNARTDDVERRDEDGYQNTTWHGRAGVTLTDAWQLEVVGRNTDADGDYDNCFDSETFATVHDCRSDFEQTSWRAAANYNGPRFTHELSWNTTDIERTFYSAGQYGFGYEGENIQLEYLGSAALNDDSKLVYGIDYKDESMEDDSQDRGRDQIGYYLEAQQGFRDSLFLTAGVRYDDNDDFGSHTSYRLSGAYLVEIDSGTVKFKSSYGTGFRAPSLYEMSYNGGPFAYPPAFGVELTEEETEGVDIGIEYFTSAGLQLEAVYFYQTVDDEIFFDPVNFSGYLQGDGDSKSQGIELVATVPIGSNWLLETNFTYNDTEQADGDDRFRRPEQLANLGLSYQPEGGKLLLNVHLRAARDAVATNGSDLDDYEVLNFNASYQLTQALQVYGRVENLLDEDYQEVPLYNTAGAAGYAGLRYAF